jgi:hypothetical protein
MERRDFLKNSLFALFSTAITSNKVLASVAETLTPTSPKVLLYLVQTNDGQWKVKATKWIDFYQKRLKPCLVKPETFKLLDIVDYDVANTRKIELWKQYNCSGRLTKIKIIENTINGNKAINSENYLNYIKSEKFKLNNKKRSIVAGKVRGKTILGKNNPIHKMKNNPFKNPDFIKRNSSKKKGTKLSEETKSKISKSRIGIISPNKGKKASEETRKKLSKALIGRTPWNKGIIYDDKIRKKMSEIRKGISQPKTSETNSKMNSLKFICPHCNREIGGRANFVRFHNDNCKYKNTV